MRWRWIAACVGVLVGPAVAGGDGALHAFGGDYLQATRVAAGIGQGIALLFGLVGLLLPSPLLIFVALFVWIGAAQEGGAAAVRAALGGVPVGRAMVRQFRSVAPEDPLSVVVAAMLGGFQQDFPVVEGGRVVGMLDTGGSDTAGCS